MAKEHTEHSEELTDPHNPPRSLLRPQTRSAALWSYLGPVVAFFAVAGIAFFYWANRGPSTDRAVDEDQAIGTVGRQLPGGFDPQPEFSSAREEIEHRGGTGQGAAPAGSTAAVTTISSVLATNPNTPQRVTLEDVTVDRVDGGTFWVKQGDARIAVVGLRDGRTPAQGDEVTVYGLTERDDNGAIRIRADRFD
jgi:hypothetical protein